MIHSATIKILVTVCCLMTLAACFHKEEKNESIPLSPSETDESSNDSSCASSNNISVNLQRVFPNLNFSQPLAMFQAPEDSNRWYTVEKGGRIYWFNTHDNNTSIRHLYIDLSKIVDTRSEGGLLGMAFHPDYAANGYVYLSFTEPGNALNSYPTMHSYVSRFTRGNTEILDPASRLDIITVPQPYTNHNGGNIAFGSDGFLYFGLGDGGSANDPLDHGQNTNTLLGALLRLDINSQTPYVIPKDNPFTPAAAGRKFMPMVCVTPGAGALIGKTAHYGWLTLARINMKKLILSLKVVIMVGAVTKGFR